MKSGFTLLELIVVVAIVGILALTSYAPYSYYLESSRTKLSTQLLKQSVSTLRSQVLAGKSLPRVGSSPVIGEVQIDFSKGDNFAQISWCQRGTSLCTQGDKIIFEPGITILSLKNAAGAEFPSGKLFLDAPYGRARGDILGDGIHITLGKPGSLPGTKFQHTLLLPYDL